MGVGCRPALVPSVEKTTGGRRCLRSCSFINPIGYKLVFYPYNLLIRHNTSYKGWKSGSRLISAA